MKFRKLLILIIFISPFLQLVLPGKIKENFILNIYDIPVFAADFIYFLIFPFLILKKEKNNSKELILILLGIFTLFLSNIFVQDYNIQRFIISSSFYFFGLFVLLLKITVHDFYVVRHLVLIAYIFISLQVIFVATGFYSIDTGVQVETGDFIRRGTTVGPATLTGHILLILAAYLLFFYKSNVWVVAILLSLFITIFFTGTRGALLAFIFVIALFFFKSKKLKGKRLIIILFVISSYLILANFINFFSTLASRNKSAIDSSDFTSGRFDRFLFAFDFFLADLQSVFVGIGGASSPYFNYLETSIIPVISPHNFYLTFLVENGIIGFTIIISLIILMYNKLKNISKIQSLIFISILLFTFNTELIGRSNLFAVLFWILYFLILNDKEINTIKLK